MPNMIIAKEIGKNICPIIDVISISNIIMMLNVRIVWTSLQAQTMTYFLKQIIDS